MGLLDRFRKGSGGFLNNVDGRTVGYRFTVTPDFGNGPQEAKETSGDKETPLYVELTVAVDGSEKGAESTHLYAGGADQFVISDDGLTLTPINKDAQLWGGTPFMQYYASLVANGLPDIDCEPGDPLNFEHMNNWRVRFVQVKDEEAMKRAAKRAGSSHGKINKEGQKKSKDGKFYDIRSLQVSAVYGQAEAAPPVVKKAPAAKVATTGKAQAAKPSIQDNGDEIASFAQETLLDILAGAKDNKIKKNDLNLLVTKKLVKDERREGTRKFLYDDGNLEAWVKEGIITYAKSGRDQVIALA